MLWLFEKAELVKSVHMVKSRLLQLGVLDDGEMSGFE